VDLGEALYREITGRSPRTEIGTWGDAIGYLLGKGGGVAAAAARLAGVPATTFRGWMRGRLPRSDRAGAVVQTALQAQRRDRLPKGREARLRAIDPEEIELQAAYDYDGTTRTVAIGQYLADTVIDDLLDAYLAGDDLPALGETFALAIGGSPFYERTFLADEWTVHDVRWGQYSAG